MCSQSPYGGSLPESGLLGRRLCLTLAAFALLIPPAASATPETREGQAFCFLSSKFPEAPTYEPGPPVSSVRSWASVYLPQANAQGVPTSSGCLFSEPLRPERWMGVTSGPEFERWISFYAEGPGRPFLSKAIARSASHLRVMEGIVKEGGLPPEVLALVFVESGFDMHAVSRKKAAGPWQFMRHTARRFGLHVGKYLDERRNPELSTRAAVRYLKYLYGLFDSWTLAAASYNSGEGRVLRAVKGQRTRDFWSLKLPRQTREFVPKVAAVLAILADPARYGFSLPDSEPLEYDIVEVNGPVKLSAVASICGSTEATIDGLNPALLRGMTPPTSVSFPLKVPRGAGELCTEELSKIRYHMVSKGETLSRIALKYDVSVGSIAKVNGLRNPHLIRPGALLTIPPLVDTSAASKAASAIDSDAGKAAEVIHYIVRPGDSLWRISAKFRTSVAQLARWNELVNLDMLKPGQVLKIFISGG